MPANRPTPDPFGDEHRSPMLNPSMTSYNNRTPSPGHHLDSYQLQDNPYGDHGGHLPMPSSDRLADQPTVSFAGKFRTRRQLLTASKVLC